MSDFFLADDLSGALDAAAAFHQAGRRVRVVWSLDAWDSAAAEEIVGYTTETRNAPPETAARVVAQTMAHGQARGRHLRFKKIDSTMRGPVAAELGALAMALPGGRILFAPSNPAMGRTVRDGVLLLRGVPVAETEFARDPANPVKESAIARLLGMAASKQVTLADAETDDDLAAAVRRIEAGGGEWVAVGSGALARAVAQHGGSSSRGEACPPPLAGPVTPVLMIGGSAHPANRGQAERLGRERGVRVFEVRMHNESGEAARAATAELRAGRSAALCIERVAWAGGRDSRAALRAITRAATQAMADSGVTRLFATGGETARSVCEALGIVALEFCAEIEAGLALAEGAGPQGRYRLAVKPGGFGSELTWVRAFDRMVS